MNRKIKSIFIVILIFLIIILISLIVLGIVRRDYFRNEKEEGSIIVDTDKKLVYDADYRYNNKYNEYLKNGDDEETSEIIFESFGIAVQYTFGMQYLSNLEVPYINIDSEDAIRTNNKLKDLYIEYAEKFDQCAEDGMGCHQILTYRTYSYQDILSVVVIYGIQSSSWVLTYQTYNFDLETGNLIEYKDMIKRLGYGEDDVLVKFKNYVDDFYDAIYDGVDVSSCRIGASIDSCSNISIQLLKESIGDGSVLFFVTENGNLNLLGIPYYDGVQNGTVNHYLFEFVK